MEKLLNKLIKKGWKPFGKRNKLYAVEDGIYILGRIASDWNTYDLRQIVSRESNLWQFVCENGMLETKGNVRVKNYWGDDECDDNCCDDDLEYWLIESALCDEDKLEDFILDNIKVDG